MRGGENHVPGAMPRNRSYDKNTRRVNGEMMASGDMHPAGWHGKRDTPTMTPRRARNRGNPFVLSPRTRARSGKTIGITHGKCWITDGKCWITRGTFRMSGATCSLSGKTSSPSGGTCRMTGQTCCLTAKTFCLSGGKCARGWRSGMILRRSFVRWRGSGGLLRQSASPPRGSSGRSRRSPAMRRCNMEKGIASPFLMIRQVSWHRGNERGCNPLLLIWSNYAFPFARFFPATGARGAVIFS